MFASCENVSFYFAYSLIPAVNISELNYDSLFNYKSLLNSKILQVTNCGLVVYIYVEYLGTSFKYNVMQTAKIVISDIFYLL